MSDIARTSIVPDDQVSLALTRVHGRLRRRRTGLRGASAAMVACLALFGVGIASRHQGEGLPATYGVDAMAPGGSEATRSVPESAGVCGHALPPAEVLGLELTIRGPLEWGQLDESLGVAQQVSVVARNVGSRSLTVWFPAGVVALDGEELVETEPAAPARLPTAVTLEPSESIELPAGLPHRSCTGDVLDTGAYTIAPVATLSDPGRPAVVVRGSSLTVRRR